MKKISLIWKALSIVAMAGLFSCSQAQREGNDDASQTGVTEQESEEKTREMIEKAEQMEADTSSG